MNSTEKAEYFFRSVLGSVNPAHFLPDMVQLGSNRNSLRIESLLFELNTGKKIYVIGTGKAASTMAKAMETVLGEHLHSGVIIAPPDSTADLSTIEMLTGSHPLPDHSSYRASQKLLAFIDSIPAGSIVLYLLSGGSSALFSLPADGITIDDLREVFERLLQSGASIQEVNTVRKTLSKVKGGQLLKHLKHSTLIDLIISDVPGDDLRFIGSGPTAAQEISFSDAKQVLDRYNLWNAMPESVRNHISRKLIEELAQNRVMKTESFRNHHSLLVSSAAIVAAKLGGIIRNHGYATRIVEPAWAGLVEDFEEHIMAHLKDLPDEPDKPHALIFFGECTVKVTGDGLGGRNQELALRMAKRLNEFERPVTFLSAGTDGIDGPTDVAGAVVDQNSYRKAKEKGVDPDDYIARNDSYRFFKRAGGHITTGPTGNNVMDLQILLVG